MVSTRTMKVVAYTSLDKDVADRVEILAKHQATNIASILRLAVQRALPDLERDLLSIQHKNGGKRKAA